MRRLSRRSADDGTPLIEGLPIGRVNDIADHYSRRLAAIDIAAALLRE